MRLPIHVSLAALAVVAVLCEQCLSLSLPRALGKRAAQAALGLGLLAPLDPQAMRSALADVAPVVQEGKVFEEVWNNVNDNFFDDTYNKVGYETHRFSVTPTHTTHNTPPSVTLLYALQNNWQALHEDYAARIRQGADERKLTEKALGLLGDKYTRLLDKKVFEVAFH